MVWSGVLFIRPVPGRPEDQRQRVMLPDDIEVFDWKILFAPVARRGDDRLVLAHHGFEIFDSLQRDILLRLAKINERPCISPVLRDHHLDGGVAIDLFGPGSLMARWQSQ